MLEKKIIKKKFINPIMIFWFWLILNNHRHKSDVHREPSKFEVILVLIMFLCVLALIPCVLIMIYFKFFG